MFTNFGGKKPNGFQVIAFCFMGSNKSCYVTLDNSSSSTLFKDIGKCFMLTSYNYISFTVSFPPFYSDSGDINGIFVGLTVVKTHTEMFVCTCICHFQKPGIALPCATSKRFGQKQLLLKCTLVFRLRNSGRPWQRRRVHQGGRVFVHHRILPGRQEWRHVEWDASRVQK